MRRTATAIVLTMLLCACGEGDAPGGGGTAATDGGAADTSPQGRTRAAIEKMFDLVRAKDRAGLAKHMAYRGRDEARKWKDSYDYGDPDEKRAVDVRYARIESLMLGGAPAFEKFQSETESEGTWLVWHVGFGGKKKAAFACLDIGDRIVLGDLDLE